MHTRNNQRPTTMYAADHRLDPAGAHSTCSLRIESTVFARFVGGENLRRVLQSSGESLALVDVIQGVVFVNDCLRDALDLDAEGERVLAAIRAAGWRRMAQKPDSEDDREADVARWDSVGASQQGYGLRTSILYTAVGASVAMVALLPAQAVPTANSSSRPLAKLTQRELEVAHFLALGLPNTEIASRLCISPYTVRRHTERVFEKLGVHTRASVGAVLRMDALR